MSYPHGERYSRSLQTLVVSYYLSYPLFSFLGLEAYCLIVIFRHTSSLDFYRETCAPHYACYVLSRPCCNGHSLLLGSYLSRIGRIENPSCSACGHSSQDTSHLILHSPATDSLRRLFTISGPGLRELPGFWGSMVFCNAPIPRKGSGNNNNNTRYTVFLVSCLYVQ